MRTKNVLYTNLRELRTKAVLDAELTR